MWKCPQCGREFEKKNQHHFCDDQIDSIDKYIESQPEEIQPILVNIRNILRKTLPDAEERISWRMPTFRKKKNIIHFAAFKKHIGIYPGDKAVEHFAGKLTDYKTSKGAIQFPYEKPIPYELISEIAKWNYETENHH